MRETSPAVGGAMTVVAVVCSLAYVMGYEHDLMNVVLSAIGQAGDASLVAFDSLRQMLAAFV